MVAILEKSKHNVDFHPMVDFIDASPLRKNFKLKDEDRINAETLMEAIKKRFRGNTETKKVQKTLLKQKFENFTGSSSEDLDQIHDRLQKLVSQLKIHERNKANLEEHSLDDFFNSLKIYETEVRHSFSPRNPTQNLAFVSSSNTDSTTDSDSAATSVFAVCAKLPVSFHPNIDSLINVSVISATKRDISPGSADLLRIQEGHVLVSHIEELSQLRLLHQKLHSQYDSQTVEFRKSRLDVLSYQAALESVESRLVVYKQNESIFQENIIVLKNEVEARDNFILTLKQKLNQAETKRDDLKLKFEKFQSSSKSLTELIASQTNNKHGLGYLSSEDDSESVSLTCPSDRLSPSGRYHAVLAPITGNFMPPKLDLVFNTTPLAIKSDHSAFNV
nr:hypothetical protein [Tanacetum cinerariifolium]